MGNISDEKLYAPIKNVQLTDKEYIQEAKKIAKRIAEFDPMGERSLYPLDPKNHEGLEQLAWIREKAMEDREILKGDFVILCYVELFREQQQQQRMIEGKGKFLKMSDKKIRAIFENKKNGGKVTAFCHKHRISRQTYYKILKVDLKQSRDIERVEQIRKEILGD